MPSRLERITNWEEKASVSHYHLDELAKACSASPSNLRRFFLQKFAKPPQKWMDDLRLRYAAELLRSSSLSVKEIAAKLDYDFPGNFARQFKRRFGVTPSNYFTREE
jgi:AraC-like DNA-binding protein